MFINLVVCVLLSILITDNFDYVKANDDFECVHLQDCPEIYDLYKDPSQMQKAYALIEKRICENYGHLPKVWCLKQLSLCRTPNGLSGFCKPLKNCKPVHKIVSNITLVEIATKDYLQGLLCPNTQSSSTSREPFTICCPSDEDEFERRLFSKNLLPDPNNHECGLNAKYKITNGEVAELNDYPWTALLHYSSTTSNDVVICAGSLISKQYIITAAHCVENAVIRSNGNLNRVTLGEYNISTEPDCIGKTCANPVVVAYVDSVIIHPDWYTQPRQLINNDIALVRLTKPVQLSAYVKPICLPQANSNIPNNMELEITGWGSTEKEESSDVKLKGIVRSFDKNRCKQYYKNEKDLNIGEGVFCAMGTDGVDSCRGDSGGPIMSRKYNANRLQITYLAGVVSFGSTKCGDEDVPALYTQTSKYIDWIKKNVRP